MIDILRSTMMAMAVEMDMDFDVLDFSGSTATTTSSVDREDHGCAWSAWSPLVDWAALTGGHDDFHDLMDSMIDCDDDDINSNSNSSSAPSPETAREAAAGAQEFGDDHAASKGVRLVHLLMAAAEALAGGGENRCRDLARVILVRLKELVSPTEGSNIERLAAQFSDALYSLLECTGGAHSNGNSATAIADHPHQNDAVAAFQILQDMSPYLKFGHFTANQAILETTAHDRRIHIVDFDIMEGIQWASLMTSLASRKDSAGIPHLRVTAVTRSGGASVAASRRSIGTVQETGRRLLAFAASAGVPFSFHQCRLDSDESFRPAALKLVKGEALIFNCMLDLPHSNHRSLSSVTSFLSSARMLNPRLITLAEEEKPIEATVDGFVGRFMDMLYQYSALYDSLEAGFPMQKRARALVERVFLGPRIAGSLGRIYREREAEAGRGGSSLGEWLSAAGFRASTVSSANICQAKLLLGLFNDGYRVEELGSNRLVLGWKSRRLLAASLWSPPLPPVSSSDSEL